MILEIPGVLDTPTATAIQAIAARDELFSSGQASAGWHARDRKNNLQARHDTVVAGLLKKLEHTLMQHDLLRAAAQPKSLTALILSRYEPGMYYGNHVDNALMKFVPQFGTSLCSGLLRLRRIMPISRSYTIDSEDCMPWNSNTMPATPSYT